MTRLDLIVQETRCDPPVCILLLLRGQWNSEPPLSVNRVRSCFLHAWRRSGRLVVLQEVKANGWSVRAGHRWAVDPFVETTTERKRMRYSAERRFERYGSGRHQA